MERSIVEIREVRLTPSGLTYGRTVDARARITDAAVLCVKLNAASQGTCIRYVYSSETVA